MSLSWTHWPMQALVFEMGVILGFASDDTPISQTSARIGQCVLDRLTAFYQCHLGDFNHIYGRESFFIMALPNIWQTGFAAYVAQEIPLQFNQYIFEI